MPGKLIRLSPTQAVGWAVHPRHPDYAVMINVVLRSLVVRSVLAEQGLEREDTGSVATQHGFTVDLTRLGVDVGLADTLRFVIGETDEPVALEGAIPRPAGTLTVEDLLSESHARRRWVTGETYLDARAAGLHTETIVDMIYRDYLGRPGDPNGLGHYSRSVDAGRITFDDIRRSFIDSDEFRLRRKYADNAPGSIFSQKIVMAGATADIRAGAGAPPDDADAVDAALLAELEGEAFVRALYRRILLKEADAAGLAHYLNQIGGGADKLDVIRQVMSELEAITAGVRVINLDFSVS